MYIAIIILKQLACPAATQNLKLNTKNRNAAIKDEDIKYGEVVYILDTLRKFNNFKIAVSTEPK